MKQVRQIFYIDSYSFLICPVTLKIYFGKMNDEF